MNNMFARLSWTLKLLLLQEGEVAWRAQREEHGVTRADQSAQAQASSAWEWPAQANIYWINNNSNFLHFSFPPGPDQTKLKNSRQWRGSCRNFWRAMESGLDTLIRGPIKNTVYVFADVVRCVKMLITFKEKSVWNGPYKLFRRFENAKKNLSQSTKIRHKSSVLLLLPKYEKDHLLCPWRLVVDGWDNDTSGVYTAVQWLHL